MAHAIFVAEARKRAMSVTVYSAGIIDFSNQPPLSETSSTCLQHQTPPQKEKPTWVGQLPLDSINRFLVMEHEHADALTSKFGISPSRISLLGSFDPHHRGAEIADPFFSYSALVYEQSYKLIRDCIIGYLDNTDDL